MPRVHQNKGQPPDPPDLPTNLVAERTVLGYLLRGGAWRDDIGAHDFALSREQTIFHTMKIIRDAGDDINGHRVCSELGEKKLKHVGVGYIADLGDGCDPEMKIEPFITKLHDATARRNILHHTHILMAHLHSGDRGADDLIQMATEAFAGLQRGRNHEEPPPAVPQWPDPLHGDAYYGVAGDLVRVLEPHTESDPAALLVQSVVAWGNMANRGPYYLAEADRHHTNEYAVIVGVSSKARKGTSWSRIRGVLTTIDQHWSEERLLSGVGSGEALIDALDEPDKRTLISESELARLLAVIGREGCTLSAIMRDAWDIGIVSTRTRVKPVRAKGVHLSMIGHITREELLRRLGDTELANGWANRVLWICARRTKLLPDGGGWPDLGDIARRMSDATGHARRMGDTRVQWDDAAAALWRSKYADLSEGRPGLLGAVTSRAEAHVVRLALIYALLDFARQISVEHLRAALAVWDYCSASARFIWGDALGDPTADEIRRALAATKLSRTEIRDLFGRNLTAEEIDRALGVLASMGLARSWTETSGGRPVTWWERM
jgi:hypothetical protein